MHRLSRTLLVLPLIILPIGRALAGEQLTSGWTTQSRQVSAKFDRFWQQPRTALRLDHGWLLARNSASHLYLLIDLTADQVQDRPAKQSPWGDYLSLNFDIDRNRKITPNKDIAFGLYPGSHRLGKQWFNGPGRYSGLQKTGARLATSFTRTPTQRQPHRLWELAIPLKELDAKPGDKLRFGVITHSRKPAFNNQLPSGQSRDFKQLIELQLAAAPMLRAVFKPNLQLMQQVLANRIQVRPDLDKLARPGGPGRGLPPGCQEPKGEPTQRIIEADGSVTLIYRNGSRKQRTEEGWKMFCADGTPIPVMVLYSTQISPTQPPTLPDQTTLQWLDFHSTGLLGIIQGLVDDPQMVERYLTTENAGWSPYETIDNRRKTIDYLLAE